MRLNHKRKRTLVKNTGKPLKLRSIFRNNIVACGPIRNFDRCDSGDESFYCVYEIQGMEIMNYKIRIEKKDVLILYLFILANII